MISKQQFPLPVTNALFGHAPAVAAEPERVRLRRLTGKREQLPTVAQRAECGHRQHGLDGNILDAAGRQLAFDRHDERAVVARVRTAPPVRLTVNPAALGPGTYYGLVTVAAPQADNAPQSAIVILNVLGTNTPPGPQLDTSGVIFNTVPGQRLDAKTVQLLNLSGAAANYSAAPSFPDERWFTVAPASGAVAAGQGVQLVLTPNTTGLAAGI